MKLFRTIQIIGVFGAFGCIIAGAWLYGPVTGLIVTGLALFFLAYVGRECELDEIKEQKAKAKPKDPEDRPLKEKACNSLRN